MAPYKAEKIVDVMPDYIEGADHKKLAMDNIDLYRKCIKEK